MQMDQAVLVKFRIQNAVKITPQDVIGMIVEERSKNSLYGVTVRSWGPRGDKLRRCAGELLPEGIFWHHR